MINPADLFVQTSNVAGTVPYMTQIPELGVRSVTGDGREFRLVQAGAADLLIGNIQQGPVIITTAVGTCVAMAVGATSAALTITSSTIAVNALAGGYFTTTGTVAVGGGQCLKIATNTVVASGTAITITLEDPVQMAITTGATFFLLPNPYNGVIIAPSTPTGAPVGLALGVTNRTATQVSGTTNGLTALYYGWLQTKGTANALINGTPAIGTGLAVGGANGALAVVSGTTSAPNFQIAQALATGVSGSYGPVNLLIS